MVDFARGQGGSRRNANEAGSLLLSVRRDPGRFYLDLEAISVITRGIRITPRDPGLSKNNESASTSAIRLVFLPYARKKKRSDGWGKTDILLAARIAERRRETSRKIPSLARWSSTILPFPPKFSPHPG